CADVYNQKVVQATMGSIARVKVMYVDILSWLTEQKNIRIYATALKGRNIKDASTIKEGIIIIGNESKGIHAEILERANVMITIPRYGKAESLNAAVATGIILSHII
ncbi:MAG: RNA methyltransferase, partial [Bacteroidota bacterium]|nr:RNA methyltransferase [Bacteroidota bacterium]